MKKAVKTILATFILTVSSTSANAQLSEPIPVHDSECFIDEFHPWDFLKELFRVIDPECDEDGVPISAHDSTCDVLCIYQYKQTTDIEWAWCVEKMARLCIENNCKAVAYTARLAGDTSGDSRIGVLNCP